MKLSIVTICYNDLAGLKETIESLRQQTSQNFEHWIIDGGSKDGTPEYLSSLQLPWEFHFISEKDRGIYNAMNKGAGRARGDFVWFLNSGDLAAEATAVERWNEGIGQNPQADLLYGQVWYQNTFGRKSLGGPVKSRHFWAGMPIGHQGMIYRRSLLTTHPYREDLRIVSDWILTEWFFANTKPVYLPGHFAIFSLTGVSSQNQNLVFREKFMTEKSWRKRLYLTLTLGTRFGLLAALRKLGLASLVSRWRYRGSGQRST